MPRHSNRATAFVRWRSGIMNAMSFRILILTALFGLTTVLAQPADLILHHGKIVTVDPQFHIADSIAIRGDRVIGVGTRSEIGKLAGPNTRQIDLKGKTVLAGSDGFPRRMRPMPPCTSSIIPCRTWRPSPTC